MSFEMGGQIFPDLPAEYLADYPNVLIVANRINNTGTNASLLTIYGAILSKKPFIFVSDARFEEEFLPDGETTYLQGMFLSDAPGVAFSLTSGTTWKQELRDDGTNPCEKASGFPVMGMVESNTQIIFEGVGANHTIYYADSNGNPTSRIYEFGSMADNTPIPDVPEYILKDYPYVTVLGIQMSVSLESGPVVVENAYGLFATEYPLVFVGTSMILGFNVLVPTCVCNTASGMYVPIEGGTFEWEDIAESTSFSASQDMDMIPIGDLPIDELRMNLRLRWANYTVQSLDLSSLEDSDGLVPGDMVFLDTPYYRGTGAIDPPEEYGVKRKVISQMAHHARRLGAGDVKLKTDDIPSFFADLANVCSWMGKLCNSWGVPNIESDADGIDPRPFRFGNDVLTATFPNATYIQKGAFQDCKKLTTVTAPKLANIWTDAFKGCSSLTSLVLGRFCSLSDVGVFEGTPIADGTGFVYVPASLVEKFKTDDTWNAFETQIVAKEETPDGAE